MTTLISTISGNGKSAVVRWNTDYKEFVVKFYVANVHQKDADYFTNNREDAVGTARLHCGGSLGRNSWCLTT